MIVIDATWYERPKGHRPRLGAGGAVVRWDGGRALLALVKEKAFGGEHFVVPKGGVEPGETIAGAAAREIAEETGLTQIRYVGWLGTLARQNFKKTWWQTSHYGLYVTEQMSGAITDPDHFGLAWFALDALPPMVWPDERTLIEAKADWIRHAAARVDGRT